MDKGTLSNLVSALVLATGFLLPESAGSAVKAFVLSVGLFAFSGGITNSLAVKMLFDRIPGLVGSGVIPNRFREIRRKIKELILEHFFDEEYLRDFLRQQGGDVEWSRYVKWSGGKHGPFESFVETQWDKLTAPEVVDDVIGSQLDRLLESSLGGLLLMVGKDTITTEIRKFVASFLSSVKGRVIEESREFELDPDKLGIELDENRVLGELRAQVDRLLERKLEQLDASHVKRMMEDVMRHHLGWLVVWGNVFGGALGAAAWLLTR